MSQEQERIQSIHKSLLEKQSAKSIFETEAMGFAHMQETKQSGKSFPSKRQQ